MIKVFGTFVFLLGVLLLHGCVAIQTFPTAARAGDTMTLAVGSAEGMTRTNTTITYTPDAAPQNPVTILVSNIRAIIPVYPDKRSDVWNSSAATGIDFTSGHGAWLTVLVIDLPASLPAGTGVVNVQTGATYPVLTSGINALDIALEILPGPGSSNTFDYYDTLNSGVLSGDLTTLETRPHYLFRPDLSASPFSPEWPTYGAVELTLTGDITGGTDQQIDASTRLILEDMDQNIHSRAQVDWSRSGNQTMINIISSQGRLDYYEVAISIFFINDNINFSALPTVSARYFDVNGVEVPGPVINASYVSN